MRNREGSNNRLVWLPDEELFGEVVGPLGAFFATIRYIKGGIEYEVLMESDEYISVEELNERDDD